MKKLEAEKILMALDGLAAYLETIRNLVISSIEEEQVAKSKILDLIPNATCLHENTRNLDTLGESSSMCLDCEQVF